MCGIVGLHLKRRPVDRADIDAMNATIAHRGPDGDGVLVEGPVGLGMRRLSIIDLKGGWQPIPNETGRIQVIQNGEIYNYRELRTELESRGHRFRTASDTEAALHAYEEWGGRAFASHLRGMFAVAIWDGERRELWVARDRIGIKPLYFAETPEGFAFGSEVKALLASPVVSGELEPRALSQYLAHGSAGIDDSFIKGVRQLRPGHVLRHDDRGAATWPYWEFRIPESPLQVAEEEARELLRERLRDVVRIHLVADVPVGAFLSGGIDSSGIVGLMAQEGGPPPKTFSIGFEAAKFNELPYARQVAERWGTEHHEEIVRPDAIEILDQIIHHLDEPFADASAIPTWYVARLAAREVKVVLSGDGGDELFAGYIRYARAARHQALEWIPVAARRWGAMISPTLPEWFPGKYFLDYASYDTRERYILEFDLFSAPLRRCLLRPEWLGEDDTSVDRLRLMEASGAHDPISEFMYHDVMRYLPLDILVKVDRMTMAHGLEARPPLLDHEFIEFAASLPIGLKYTRDGRQKHILKEAMAPLLPPSLIDRKKSGFSVPLRSWFAGPLMPLFQEQVLREGRVLDYLTPEGVRHLFEENRQGRRDHGLQLWAILLLELWLRGRSQAQRPTPCPCGPRALTGRGFLEPESGVDRGTV